MPEDKNVHRPMAFRTGDAVVVLPLYKKPEAWVGEWLPSQQRTVGSEFIITESHPQQGFCSRQGLWYPSTALEKSKSKDINNAQAFKVGDRVRVVKRVNKAVGWTRTWSADMNNTLANVGSVTSTDRDYGIQVSIAGSPTYYWYPSSALELADKPKVRRVRVGAGPWDEAPCPHLRWHLMGFYREKLKVLGFTYQMTNVDGKDANNIVFANGEVMVACTKCNKQTTLKF